MIDVDRILRDHAAGSDVGPGPDGWDRLLARLDPIGGPGQSGEGHGDEAAHVEGHEVGGRLDDPRGDDGQRDAGQGDAGQGDDAGDGPCGDGRADPLVVDLGARPTGRRPRGLLLVGVAAVVLAVVAAAALVDRSGDGATAGARATTPGTPTATGDRADGGATDGDSGGATTPGASTSSPGDTPEATVPLDPATMPSQVAAIVDVDGAGDGLGAVVLLDRSSTGEGGPPAAERVLVAAPPASPGAPGAAAGPASLDRLPDGSVVYGTCCEPAAGSIHIVGPEGGEPRLLGPGEHPAASPDGSQVAVFLATIGVGTIDVATGRFTPITVAGEPLVRDPEDRVTGLAWSPDGTRLVVDWLVGGERADTRRVVELVDLAAGTRRTLLQEDEPGGTAHGAFLADGRVAFVTGVPPGEGEAVVGTGISIYDPVTDSAEVRFGGLAVTDLDTSADGRWVLATSEGGALRAFDGTDLIDAGTVVAREGTSAAAW